MSETVKKDVPKEETAQPKKKATVKKAEVKPVMYLGPTIRGVALHGRVYRNGFTKAITEKMEEIPAFKQLFVPIGELSRAQKELQDTGSAIYVCYEAVSKEVKKAGKEDKV